MIIDAHTHIFPPWLETQRKQYVEQDTTFGTLYGHSATKLATVESLIASMDDQGIDVAFVIGIGWSDQGLAKHCNDYIIDAIRRFPARLVGFCSVNPIWGKTALREIERCASLGARGIGELHPDTQGFDLSNREVMSSVMNIVDELGLVVLTHSSEPVGHRYPGKGATTPEVLLTFINHFPRTPIICAHWGGGLPFYNLMPEIASSLKNVYFDTAATPYLYDPSIFQIVPTLLPYSHILFGTDYPLMPQTRVLQQLTKVSLSSKVRDGILGYNAAQLMGLPIISSAAKPKLNTLL